MNKVRQLLSRGRRRALLVVLAWLCCVSSFSTTTPVQKCPTNCECSMNRDGLRAATCTDAQWNEIAYPNIHVLILKSSHVEIECNIPEDISLLFPQLNFFTLKNCSLAYIPSNSFQGLKLLQEVDLSHNYIRKFSHSLFAANSKLRYVNLENNPFSVGNQAFLLSDSIWEVNLAACGINRITSNTFKGLPNVRYLTLANNKLHVIEENTLPKGLKMLNLSGNRISDIPLVELNRLNGLKEIDLSRNPVNCSCELMGFQNRISGEGTIFRNGIQCALPTKYAGYSLTNVPQHLMCDVKLHQDDQISSNLILLNEGYVMDEGPRQSVFDDEFIFNVTMEKVVGDKYKQNIKRNIKQEAEGSGFEDSVDGSGDASSTEGQISFTNLIPSDKIDIENNIDKYSSSQEITTVSQFKSNQSQDVEEITFQVTHLTNMTNVDAKYVLEEKNNVLASEESSIPGEPELKQKPTTDKEDVTLATTYVKNLFGNNTNVPVLVDSNINKVNGNEHHATDEEDVKSATKSGLTDTTISVTEEGASTKNGQDSTSTVQVDNEYSKHKLIASNINDKISTTILSMTSEPDKLIVETAATTVSTVQMEQTTISRNHSVEPLEKHVPGQITTNRTEKDMGSARYIIPILLIAAIVLICVSIYFSQNSCRMKTWNQNDPKTNNTTEMQDVNLLGLDKQSLDSDRYSKKYLSEADSTQTEKLMGGDDDVSGEKYSSNNNTSTLPIDQSLTDVIVPDAMKSTTRGVTNDLESPTKTLTTICKR